MNCSKFLVGAIHELPLPKISTVLALVGWAVPTINVSDNLDVEIGIASPHEHLHP
jgi:hypothetical protein